MDRDRLYAQALEGYRRGEPGQAKSALAALLAAWPTDTPGLVLLGVVQDKTEAALAIALLDQALAYDPGDASAWYNLAVLEAERDNRDRALEAYERAVAIDPLHADALCNGCELLRRAERFEEALVWADRRAALGDDSWSAHLNRAVCLHHMRRFDEAMGAFGRAEALCPDRPIIHWERFSLMLFQKRFAEAWDDFEHRFTVGALNGVFAYPFAEPRWRGEALAGRHILIHNEQGLGDQLMFACAVAEVIEPAAEATLVVAPPLVELFQASFPTARVLPALYGRFAGDHPEPPWLKALPKVDYQIPIGSLMALRRRAPDSFDDPKPYLRPSTAARRRWAGFEAGGKLRVGLCWASNPALFRSDSARRATRKSMALETLSPLAGAPGAAFVSVLNWPIDPMPQAFVGRLQDVSSRLGSLDDTAALIERLDLVITVDTAVAHLAGALGKKTWLLLHDFPDCRWELQSRRSYWYADMRLFRQSRLDDRGPGDRGLGDWGQGDWGPVVDEVAGALRARVEGHGE